MGFCVECGTEGVTLEGVCAKHFFKKHKPVKAPERIRVARCAHCGKLELPRGWVVTTVEDAIPTLLARDTERDAHVKNVQFTWVSRQEDPTSVALTVKAKSLVGEWDFVTSFRTRIRVRGGACPNCSKQSADYFVGTVQVRAIGRPLTDEEGNRAAHMAERARSGGEEFVSRIEPVQGGIDVRVSTNSFAKRLARDLAKAFGGAVGGSATLHTQREGREMYRSTYVVRIPSYREGDTIRWKGVRYRVEAIGDPVRLRDVDSGAIARVRVRDLRTAKPAGE
jgi:nonsense-mediated mRNA decay protein 3